MSLSEVVMQPGMGIGGALPADAVALLQSDHREMAAWFDQFDNAPSRSRKLQLARRICRALTVHMAVKEDIFYPAFLDATGNMAMHREAGVDDMMSAELIEDIEASQPDDLYDAKMQVLAGMVRRQVLEQERPDGMLAAARASDMDLERLGDQMVARKKQLQFVFADSSRRHAARSHVALHG